MAGFTETGAAEPHDVPLLVDVARRSDVAAPPPGISARSWDFYGQLWTSSTVTWPNRWRPCSPAGSGPPT
jgi:hypothetical protein